MDEARGVFEELTQAIDRLIAALIVVPASPPVPDPAAAAVDGALDVEELMERVAGDLGLLQELATLFAEAAPVQLAELRDAVAAGDARAVERLGHTLKGSVGSFAAREAFETAREIETMGREGNLAGAEGARGRLEDQVDRMQRALAAMTGGDTAPAD
jgi:two-component system, sensor histidine kinase and response regulator